MLECKRNQLVFSFPEVHAGAQCTIEFQRTLRLPDDDKTYPLPPSLGNFPLKNVDDYKANLSEATLKRGGVMLPMYQSEALWISFGGRYVQDHGTNYPMAVKIAAGKRSAVTAAAWVDALKEKDYIVIPVQPWIDGFMLTEGIIRQFVAAPLGQGFTVEEQLTKKAEFGGIQLEVFPMKKEEFEKRFPKRPVVESSGVMGGMSLGDSDELCDEVSMNRSFGPAAAAAPRPAGASMGMAAGGRMKQDIHPDPYGLDVWDLSHKTRTFVHLMNSLVWKQVTGEAPPTTPMTAAMYKRYNLPWFDYYSDAGALGATDDSAKIKSVEQMAVEKGYSINPDNVSVAVDKTVPIHAPKSPHTVSDGKW